MDLHIINNSVHNGTTTTMDSTTSDQEEQDNIINMNISNQPINNRTDDDNITNLTTGLSNNKNKTSTTSATNTDNDVQIISNTNVINNNSIREDQNHNEALNNKNDNNALTALMNNYSDSQDADDDDTDAFAHFRCKNEEMEDDKIDSSEDEEDDDDGLSSVTSILSVNDSDNSSIEEIANFAPKKSKGGIKLKSSRNNGELDLDDLPPIEDLQISVPEDKCLPIGTILNIVDTLVLVKSLKNTPPLDLDSILFLDKGQRSLGKIFDVIGPVTAPVYCVRFNSNQHIVDSNIKIEQNVYCAPQTDYTSYVPVPTLLGARGSDASWKEDREPPPEVVEFSDDEEERRIKRATANRNRNNRSKQNQEDVDESEPKSKRPTPFEQRMNLRNLLMTASYERRNRLSDMSFSRSKSFIKSTTNTNNVIRAPILPDIPPLPQPSGPPINLSSNNNNNNNNNVILRFSSPEITSPPRFVDTTNNSASGMNFSPPRFQQQHTGMMAPVTSRNRFSTATITPSGYNPRFNQNKNNNFSNAPRFAPTISPPVFNLPPPPIYNDMFLFSQPPPPPNLMSPIPFGASHPPGLPHPFSQMQVPPPVTSSPMSLPFQFGMPPLIGNQNVPRYHHNNTAPRPNMRPTFGYRSRF